MTKSKASQVLASTPAQDPEQAAEEALELEALEAEATQGEGEDYDDPEVDEPADVSQQSWMLYGDTYRFKREILGAGGEWTPATGAWKCDAGTLDRVRKALSALKDKEGRVYGYGTIEKVPHGRVLYTVRGRK